MADVEQILGRVPKAVRAAKAYNACRPPCRIRLDGNESPTAVSAAEHTEILDFIAQVSLNRYPDPECLVLRKLISESAGAAPESIVFGNGSDELIQMVIQTFCGRTQMTLVPSPTFSMYEISARLLGKKVVSQNLNKAFDLDASAMSRAIERHDPDIIFLASPNSPTGNLLSLGKLESVIAAARGLVVVDEAYFSFCGRTVISLMDAYENLAVMRTFSKIGFAAIRLGVIFMRPALAAELSKARLPYNINSLTQGVARLFFEKRAIFERACGAVASERERMFAQLRPLEGITIFPSDANFFLIRFRSESAANKVYARLLERGIAVRKLSGGRVSDCLRVTVGLAEENREFEKALREIVPWVS